MANKRFRILSIDGGGIRGIIPAMFLQQIEEKTGKSTCELFDLIAGTSTGGLLALCLTKPDENGKPALSAEALIGLYEETGKDIFPSRWRSLLGSVRNVVRSKYPTDPLKGVLQEYLGNTMLSEALTRVMVTSYEIERRRPWFFTSHDIDKTGRDFPMHEVARATSAAPTFFAPAKLDVPPNLSGKDKEKFRTSDTPYFSFIDGGVFANNPANCALVEALAIDPSLTLEDIQIVSLGTGEFVRPLKHPKYARWGGLLSWAAPILDVVFDGISDTTDYHNQKLFAQIAAQYDNHANGSVNGKKASSSHNEDACKHTVNNSYFRFQLELGDENDKMDDAGVVNISKLMEDTRTFIAEHEACFKLLCESLKA